MTLLELTVVILVLLTLVSILFVGGKAWKAGTDRATCILTIRNIQHGMRSYANLNNLNPGDTDAWPAKVIGPGLFVESANTDGTPNPCKGGADYAISPADKIPLMGVVAATCGLAGPDEQNHNPSPTETADW